MSVWTKISLTFLNNLNISLWWLLATAWKTLKVVELNRVYWGSCKKKQQANDWGDKSIPHLSAGCTNGAQLLSKCEISYHFKTCLHFLLSCWVLLRYRNEKVGYTNVHSILGDKIQQASAHISPITASLGLQQCFSEAFAPAENAPRPWWSALIPMGIPFLGISSRLEEVEGEAIPSQELGGPLRLLVHVFVIQVPPGKRDTGNHREPPGTTNFHGQNMAVGQNLVPLVNIKIAGKWMFIPLKMVLIGIDS